MKAYVVPALIAAALSVGGAVYMIGAQERAPEESAPSEKGGFSGVVVDGETGNPLEAEVIVSSGGREVARTACDAKGRFDVALEDGVYMVRALHSGYVPRGEKGAARKIEVVDATHFVNAKISLWPQSFLKGRILAGERGVPAELEVSYQRDASGAQNYVLKRFSSDETGQFFLSGAYAGIVGVSIEAEGFANLRLDDIVLQAGKTVDLGDIPLREGVSIHGTVRDLQSDTPLSGVRIKVVNPSGVVLSETQSTSTGAYRLPAVEAAEVRLVATTEGYRVFGWNLRLGNEVNRELDLQLKRAWGLSVEIVNETGREPTKSHLSITDLSTQKVVYEAIKDNGRHAINELRGGPYLVTAESFDKETRYDVRAFAGDSVKLVLKPYARIGVEVVDRQGVPVKEGQYRYIYHPVSGGEEVTNSWLAFEGESFELSELKPGAYRVEVRVNKDHISSSPELHVKMGDNKSVKIPLTEGGVLRGHVVSEKRHRGIPARVEWMGTSTSTVTDSEGYFVFDNLPVNAFSIKVIPDVGYEKVFSGIVVEENGELEREFEVNGKRIKRNYGERNAQRERGSLSGFGEGAPPFGEGAPLWDEGNSDGQMDVPAGRPSGRRGHRQNQED